MEQLSWSSYRSMMEAQGGGMGIVHLEGIPGYGLWEAGIILKEFSATKCALLSIILHEKENISKVRKRSAVDCPPYLY